MLPPKFRLQQFFLKQVMGRNFLPKFIARGGGGEGDSHMKQLGMLVGNFEFNP